jgi:hypothetical protein
MKTGGVSKPETNTDGIRMGTTSARAGHDQGLVRRASGPAVQSERDRALAARISDVARAAEETADHDAAIRSIDAFHDTVNEIERKRIAWEFAPVCPDCVRGVTDQDDICERCCGEGRILDAD